MGFLSDYKDRLALAKAQRAALPIVTCSEHLTDLFGYAKRMYPVFREALTDPDENAARLLEIFKRETASNRDVFVRVMAQWRDRCAAQETAPSDVPVDLRRVVNLIEMTYEVKNRRFRLVTRGDKMAACEAMVRAIESYDADEPIRRAEAERREAEERRRQAEDAKAAEIAEIEAKGAIKGLLVISAIVIFMLLLVGLLVHR